LPLVRLQKVIAQAGVASRRKAEELITAGRVTVNGRVVQRLGSRVDPERDRVAVDGRVIGEEPKVVIILNKPPGYVSTVRDDRGRPTALDLLPGLGRRIYPVGRLDYDTGGLILLTNDGPLAFGLTHPSRQVIKTYVALVRGHPGRTALKSLAEGVWLEDGRTAPARVRLLGAHGGNAILELTIHEGRNREVRRMCEAVGHPVIDLKRTRIGPLTLGSLRVGEFRTLDESEVEALRRAAGLVSEDAKKMTDASPRGKPGPGGGRQRRPRRTR